jgi:hypothetical protein
MIHIAAHHAAPAIYTPQDKQTRFSKRNKGKRKIKRNRPRFEIEFKPHQVNSYNTNEGKPKKKHVNKLKND